MCELFPFSHHHGDMGIHAAARKFYRGIICTNAEHSDRNSTDKSVNILHGAFTLLNQPTSWLTCCYMVLTRTKAVYVVKGCQDTSSASCGEIFLYSLDRPWGYYRIHTVVQEYSHCKKLCYFPNIIGDILEVHDIIRPMFICAIILGFVVPSTIGGLLSPVIVKSIFEICIVSGEMYVSL